MRCHRFPDLSPQDQAGPEDIRLGKRSSFLPWPPRGPGWVSQSWKRGHIFLSLALQELARTGEASQERGSVVSPY